MSTRQRVKSSLPAYRTLASNEVFAEMLWIGSFQERGIKMLSKLPRAAFSPQWSGQKRPTDVAQDLDVVPVVRFSSKPNRSR